MMDIIEHAVDLASEEYPVGSMSLGLPRRIGVWKKMDGVENSHPGSGLDYRSHPSRTAVYFERVA